MPRKIKPKDPFPMDRKIEHEEIRAALDVLKDKRLTFAAEEPYDRISEFEKLFANYMGVKYAIACSSGTTALHICLAAAGIGAGDEVLVPAYTFVATATAVLHQNAIPVFVDIDEKTFCMDINDIEQKITPKTKAVIPVHLFAHPVDLDPIFELAEKHNLIVIEDACQAHGAEYKGAKVGTFGLAGCFSFYESKNMMTGEGGIIITNNEVFAKECRLVRHHGESEWYVYDRLGFNYRMNQISAAIGIEQLKKLDKMNEGRIRNAEYLNILLKDLPGIILPEKPEFGTHVYHAYALRVDPNVLGMTGKEFAEELNREFQITKLIYPAPLYDSKLFKERLGYGERQCPFTCPFLSSEVHYNANSVYADCPRTETVCTNIIGLPNWHQLSYVELSLVAMKFLRTLEEVLKKDFEIERRIIGAMMETNTTPAIYGLIKEPPKVSNPVKVGVIGLGNIGQVHAASYFACPWTDLHSFATRNPLALHGAALFFGLTNIYEDFNELLADPELQAVSICVPTYAHKDYIIAAVKAGKHILVEKPFLLDPEEYEEIQSITETNNVKLMVAHICRFQSHYAMTKKTIDNGAIGPIVSMHAHRRGRGPPDWAGWFFDVEKSGGIVVDLAIHDIDLALWFVGSEDQVVSVYAVGSNKVYPEIKTWDTVIVTLRFSSGVLATIEASWAEPDLPYQLGSNTGFIINGESGTIRVDPSKQPSEKITELFGSQPTFDEMSQLPAFVDQVGSFAKAIINNSEVPVPAEDGLRALKVARAALESLKTGKAVEM